VKHQILEVIRPQFPTEGPVSHLQDLKKLRALVHTHDYARHRTSSIFWKSIRKCAV